MNPNLSDLEITNLRKLRKHLAECTVLLKYNGQFPLESAGRIAAYGNGVRHTVKGGTGSGEVNSRFFINAEKGLENAGFELTTKEWLDGYDRIRKEARKEHIRSIRLKARQEKTNIIAASMGAVFKEPEYTLPLHAEGEAAVYILSRNSGEGNDRLPEPGDFKMTQTEIRDILFLDKSFPRFMLVLNTGGPVDLSPVRSVSNILVLSQLGVETGNALADILLGKAVPSGKLTTTWAGYEEYYPSDFGTIDDTRYTEGIYVGYRYFDAASKKPLFPFGFGLGYAGFEILPREISVSGKDVRVAAEVLNRGKYPGKETVQLYISAPDGKLRKEVRSLAGFAKTKELKPGESEKITICFDLTDRASYDEETASYLLEKGDYVLSIGADSRNLKEICVCSLERTVIVRKVNNAFSAPSDKETEKGVYEKPALNAYVPPVRPSEDTESLPRFLIDPDLIPTETVRYGQTPAIPERIRSLSDQELAYLGIGAFDPKGGLLSVIGNASKAVAGAAGETTSMLKKKGIPSIVMADGPAGLRLSKTYYTDHKGVHAAGSALPETMLDFLPSVFKKILNRNTRIPRGARIGHQYCTALPIGTAVAQSWNPEFAGLCGDIVGSEMEKYHVRLWLAPGMNIHRNVLCGRNFEYFSEDPLVTGTIAAAITQGVQSHKNCGVTIKHFAANNQETNRYSNNSIVSERALREIYLRGFEICIRESRPMAVMTSYNLLNGIHTSERADLNRAVLRDEFGFEGIVMTDWVVAAGLLSKGKKYPAPNAARAARAGHSLFMPGSKKDYKQLLTGLENGTVRREDLMRNAADLYRIIKRLEP